VTGEVRVEEIAAPDFVEPFEAWRVWRVVAGDGHYKLASAIKPTVWAPGEPLVATCLQSSPVRRWWQRFRGRDEHPPAPAFRCECGIYAADLPQLRHYLNDGLAPSAVGRVLGLVSLWGTVVECERGFRASHAYPSRIYVPADASSRRDHSWDDLIGGLEIYDVPVEPLAARCSEAVWALEHERHPTMH
jgi:hypothetical protein